MITLIHYPLFPTNHCKLSSTKLLNENEALTMEILRMLKLLIQFEILCPTSRFGIKFSVHKLLEN